MPSIVANSDAFTKAKAKAGDAAKDAVTKAKAKASNAASNGVPPKAAANADTKATASVTEVKTIDVTEVKAIDAANDAVTEAKAIDAVSEVKAIDDAVSEVKAEDSDAPSNGDTKPTASDATSNAGTVPKMPATSDAASTAAPTEQQPGTQTCPKTFCMHAASMLAAIPPTTTILSWLPGASGGADVYLNNLREKIPYVTDPPSIYEPIQHLGFDYVHSWMSQLRASAADTSLGLRCTHISEEYLDPPFA